MGSEPWGLGLESAAQRSGPEPHSISALDQRQGRGSAQSSRAGAPPVGRIWLYAIGMSLFTTRRDVRGTRPVVALLALVAAAVLASGCYWERSSTAPVPRLAHPAFDTATAATRAPFRFAVFGDQKGLAKSGEWDALLREIGALDPPAAFLLDTGDIVENGVHRDQFGQLEQILSVVRDRSYLLAVGNHEIDHDDEGATGTDPSSQHQAGRRGSSPSAARARDRATARRGGRAGERRRRRRVMLCTSPSIICHRTVPHRRGERLVKGKGPGGGPGPGRANRPSHIMPASASAQRPDETNRRETSREGCRSRREKRGSPVAAATS